MDVLERFTTSVPLIERAIRFICRKNRVDPSDYEDFAATVMLKLIENDYAIVRKFEERSEFGTFLATVIQRLLLDYRTHNWGRWHPSAVARRLGDVAVLLEQLLHRDGYSFEEAATLIERHHPTVTRAQLAEVTNALPQRTRRPRTVELDEATAVAVTSADAAEYPTLHEEHRHLSKRVSGLLRAAIDRLPREERILLYLRFECDFTNAQIARSLHLSEKAVSRRLQRHLRWLRKELESSGVDAAHVLTAIGTAEVFFDHALSDSKTRPSILDESGRDPGEEIWR